MEKKKKKKKPVSSCREVKLIIAHCQTTKGFQDFDFWVGEWNVFTTEGVKIGENSISKQEQGCLILEKWHDISGGTGQSYNYFNPETKKWRQVWVSSVMIIDYQGGLTKDGAMELVGEVLFYKNNQKAKLLGRWSKQSDGSVRQYFAKYDPKKEKWIPMFVGIYKKKTSI